MTNSSLSRIGAYQVRVKTHRSHGSIPTLSLNNKTRWYKLNEKEHLRWLTFIPIRNQIWRFRQQSKFRLARAIWARSKACWNCQRFLTSSALLSSIESRLSNSSFWKRLHTKSNFLEECPSLQRFQTSLMSASWWTSCDILKLWWSPWEQSCADIRKLVITLHR